MQLALPYIYVTAVVLYSLICPYAQFHNKFWQAHILHTPH